MAKKRAPEKKPRGHCWKCGAVKYTEFLRRVPGAEWRRIERWQCIDAKRCARRAALYRGDSV